MTSQEKLVSIAEHLLGDKNNILCKALLMVLKSEIKKMDEKNIKEFIVELKRLADLVEI